MRNREIKELNISNSSFDITLSIAFVACLLLSGILISVDVKQMASTEKPNASAVEVVYTNNKLWHMQVNYIDLILQDNGMYLHDSLNDSMM